MQSGDGTVIMLIVAAIAIWAFYSIRGKMRRTVDQASPFDYFSDEEVPDDDAVRLLEEYGYEVLCGKRRIPIQISLSDGNEVLQSRLFIDYFAERDGLYYAAKVAKGRKPIEMTGSSVRDHLLIYQLLYPQTTGVLYLDLQQHTVKQLVFQMDLEHDAEEDKISS